MFPHLRDHKKYHKDGLLCVEVLSFGLSNIVSFFWTPCIPAIILITTRLMRVSIDIGIFAAKTHFKSSRSIVHLCEEPPVPIYVIPYNFCTPPLLSHLKCHVMFSKCWLWQNYLMTRSPCHHHMSPHDAASREPIVVCSKVRLEANVCSQHK